MVRVLTLGIVVLILGTGCATCPSTKIDTPERPNLIAVTPELWEQVPLEAQDIFTYNDLALKAYAKQLEARLDVMGKTP